MRTLNTDKHHGFFPKTGQDSTSSFCFCLGTHGNSKEKKEKNTKGLLKIKNYTKTKLKYSSDIQRIENGEFEETSNIGISVSAEVSEIWPYMIYLIGIRSIERYKP